MCNPGIVILLRGLPGTSVMIIFFTDMKKYLLDTTEEKDYFVLHFRRGHTPQSEDMAAGVWGAGHIGSTVRK